MISNACESVKPNSLYWAEAFLVKVTRSPARASS